MKLNAFIAILGICALAHGSTTNKAVACFMPIENSEGRSLRYYADHPLDVKDAKSEHAVVIVHGVNGGMRDGTGRVRSLLAARGDTSKVLFVAPCFVVPELRDPIDKTRLVVSMTEEEKKKIVYWKRGTWQGGGDSPVAPGFSSYDALDRIFAKLNDKSLYPSLKTVLICGYSAGGQSRGERTGIQPLRTLQELPEVRLPVPVAGQHLQVRGARGQGARRRLLRERRVPQPCARQERLNAGHDAGALGSSCLRPMNRL